MSPADLEAVYEDLAETLDAMTEAQRPVFLAKLALLMAEALGDAGAVRGYIAAAVQNLDA
ncbi:DUF2783 domain-containing protein [Oceanicella sp. SM1341]|uniref:DUF2783 domain-containing protein n=1 Tax=Oceanicella sp. SM1341 TaxID=1548889 RepID=UPI000E4918B2|nr:DUF2783 domain-containing protein [Oceanicella sp. SM1341]